MLEEEAKGSVYVATPFDNPFGSLLALYMVAKIPDRGILVKQAGKVRARTRPPGSSSRPSTTCRRCPSKPSSSTSTKATAPRW